MLTNLKTFYLKNFEKIIFSLILISIFGSAKAHYNLTQQPLIQSHFKNEIIKTPKQWITSSKTLANIYKNRTINIGFNEASFPFSYRSLTGKPNGYAYDIALAIKEEIEHILAIPIMVTAVRLDYDERIYRMKSQLIQIECGSTSQTIERQKHALFSPAFYIAHVRMAVRDSSNINNLNDLKNKNIALEKGTHAANIIEKLNKQHNLAFHLFKYDTTNQALESVLARRTDAFILDDVLLSSALTKRKYQIQKKSKKTIGAFDNSLLINQLKVAGEAISEEKYACMTPKKDEVFNHLVSNKLKKMQSSGELLNLYNRWFLEKLPDSDMILNNQPNAQTAEIINIPQTNSNGKTVKK